MKKVLNKNNLIFILILMTLFNLMMPNISYAANVSINDVLKETVAGWYVVLRGLGIGAMILLLLFLTAKAALSKRSADSALVKRMLLDWLVGLFLIIFIHYFMVFCINMNQDMVLGSEKMGQKLSGMKEGQEISLYESVVTKAYEIKFKPGTIGMILYIMLVYYAYKFAIVYLKRYVNVLVLILLAPIVCVMYAFKKVISGKSITLKKWVKEFIYNVFLQSLHALMYGNVVGLTLKYSNDGESFIGAILCMIVFAVIFKVDKLVRKLFNSVGGDTSVTVSKIDSAFSNTKKAAGTFVGGNVQAGATALMFGSNSDEFANVKSKFGENLNWNKVTDTFKGDAVNIWGDVKNGASDFYKENKEGITEAFEDLDGTIKGDHKYVSEEAIAKEQERLDNAGFLGKTWRKMVALPGTIKEELPKKIEELKIYLENKKEEIIKNIQELKRDDETIRSIPQMIRNLRRVPPAIQYPNPVTGELEYDENYDALIDFDLDSREVEEKIITFIEMSSGEISSAVILAMGYESIVRCPKLGMMMLAENNYRNMLHPEIPVESRRVIAGIKYEKRPALTFKNFENGSIETIQKVAMSDISRNFAGVSTMQRVAKGIMQQRISLRPIAEGAEKFTVTYFGKKNAARSIKQKHELLFQRVHALQNDFNIAMNINILNDIEALRTQGELSNLTPETLEMLKNAGVLMEVKNGDLQGGYVVLDRAIENAVIRTKVGQYVTENAGTETANKINQFLNANPDSELAMRISNYIIENPESTLASVIDRIQITEDGRIITKIDNFQITDRQPNLAQLGIVTDQGIVQKILTADGREVEQIIDLQGRIISEAVDENGNIIEFPVEKGRRVQTVITPDGNMILQVISQDGSSIMPLMLNEAVEGKTEIVNLDSVPVTNGILTEVAPPVGKIQIVNRETGEVEAFRPEEIAIQLVRDEDGNLKIVMTTQPEVIEINENIVVQNVDTEAGMIQILNEETNEVQTAYGEVAVQILKAKGVELTPEEQLQFEAVTEAGRIEDETLQLVKDEDGNLRIVKVATQQVVDVDENAILQVIKPEDGMVQILDQETNTVETAYGEVAIQILKDKGIILTPEEEIEFVAREELKEKITAVSDAIAINLVTGETENVVDLAFQADILTALVSEQVERPAEVTTEDEQLRKLDSLCEEIGALSSSGLVEELLDNIEAEKELVFVELGAERTEELKRLTATGEIAPVLEDVVSELTVESVVNQVNASDEDTSYSFMEMFNKIVERDDKKSSTTEATATIYEELTDSSTSYSMEYTYESETKTTTTPTTSSFEDLYKAVTAAPIEDRLDTVVEAVTAATVVEETATATVADASLSELYNQIMGKPETKTTPGVKQTKVTKERVEAQVQAQNKAKGKAKTTISEEESVSLVVEITGAVINPCKVEAVVLKVTTVDDIVRKYCGGFAENINRDKYKDIAHKQIRAYNGKVLQIPEMTKQEIADKKKKTTKNKAEHKITIYLSGYGAEIFGEKVIAENSKVYDIKTLFRRDANREAIRVNDRVVSLSYVLKDGDEVYVPLLSSEEKDSRRGIPSGFIDKVIRDSITKYIHDNRLKAHYSGKTELEILQIIAENRVLRKNFNKSILEELKTKHNTGLPEEELDERIKKYIDGEIERLKAEQPKTVSKKDKKSSRYVEDSPETTVTIVDMAQLIQQLGAVRKETVTVGQQEALVGSARGMRLTGKGKRDSQITIINESLSENRGEPIRRRGNLIAK